VERVAATWPHEAPAILEEQLGDPSEHVGVGLAAALVRLGREEALLLAERLAESPRTRVRLAVAVYLGRAAPNLEARVLGRILSRRLQREVYRGVVVALCRASAAAVVAFPELALVLRAALDGVIQADREGESTEEAAAARRVCLRVADTGSSQLYGALAPRISSVVQNTKVFFSWKELGISVALTDDQIGMVLAELSREDLGLWAERHRDGLWLQRGDRLRIRTWRFLHELVHPAPNKRQSWSHMVGRDNRGSLRAPPQRMAEVTATTTPGERTLVERDGSWVPALPAVDDFLQLSAPARIYSAYGVTELRAAPSWFRRMVGKIRLTFAYPRLARLRTAALSAEEPSQRAAYLRTVERELGISVHFHLDSPAPPRMEQLRSSVSIAAALAWLGERRDAVLAPFASSQPALGWFAAGILASLLVRAAQRRESIRQARQKIPLVMGGWGTRGKSGTERIKAGLFHGLGYSVFVKTTGCEAMFISARPGLTAREIFIFRPQDKSSIWEQADMVEQAAGMGAQVMLWECMALRPQLVELLQQDWMRDDLVTLTNAFPDHEDVQGPAGHDIATVISTFMPCRSVAVTSEREFLPLFRERARERQSELDAVPAEEAELLGQDLLDLFPYQEHPRNIALVARVAERLGLDRMLAIATMAEFVVPDLGVLRIYPQVQVHGRFLRFINGMSANERTGCVSNWRRTGCDRIDVDQQPEQAIVVVVNNRDINKKQHATIDHAWSRVRWILRSHTYFTFTLFHCNIYFHFTLL
jgi:poly-gamma-glutamate synthase PgsB/CapB